MIISFNGDEGSGKSTISKKVAEKFSYERYYMGQIFRDMAQKRGLALVDYLKLGETDPSVDKEVDDYLISLAKTKDDFVIDSRMAWHFIPNSVKIFLKVTDEEGAKRILDELQKENQRNEGSDLNTIEDVMKKVRARRETDDARYWKYYGVNVREEKNYDFVLDTTNFAIEEVFDKVMKFIDSKMK